MPDRAPRPVPTRMAVGVASPRAQGQAMIRTEANAIVAKTARGSGPTTYQITHVTTAMPSTTGTKMPEIRSASFWIGGLDAWACSDEAHDLRQGRLAPDRGGLDLERPFAVESAADDPVAGGILDRDRLARDHRVSSTAERPERTIPSTGTASPGLTASRAPRGPRRAARPLLAVLEQARRLRGEIRAACGSRPMSCPARASRGNGRGAPASGSLRPPRSRRGPFRPRRPTSCRGRASRRSKNEGGGRSDRDERVHVGGSVRERADRAVRNGAPAQK